MQEPSLGDYVSSFAPFMFVLLVWIGAFGVIIWTVLLLRRIARALERIADTLARRESEIPRL